MKQFDLVMGCFVSPILKHLFNGSCVAVTIAMIAFWVAEFIKDNDLCLVDYIYYAKYDKGSVHPTVSLCFLEPISTDLLKIHNATFDDQMYARFLRGEMYDDNLAKLDFNNVTYPLLGYIGKVLMGFINKTYLEIPKFDDTRLQTYSTVYNSYTVGRISKCIALEMNPAQIDYIYYVIRKDIFPGGIRPSNWGNIMLPVVTFQLFPITYSPWQFKRYAWQKRKKETSEYYMAFTVTSVEILTRRNKPKAPCIEDWKSYGKSIKTIFEEAMDKVGCRAPYQHSSKPLPRCQTKEKMKEMYTLLQEDPTKAYTPPCDTLENLQYKYDESDYEVRYEGPEWFWFFIDMPHRFKEIIQTKALDVHSLVGNCGGYIGLFLGG